LDTAEKIRNVFPYRESKYDSSGNRSLASIPTELCRIWHGVQKTLPYYDKINIADIGLTTCLLRNDID
jgi:hypothetical protein